MHLSQFIRGTRFTVIAKPNARRTELLGYDSLNDTIKIAIKAPAEDGKANKALLKYLKKALGKECRIVSGATSRKKVIAIL